MTFCEFVDFSKRIDLLRRISDAFGEVLLLTRTHRWSRLPLTKMTFNGRVVKRSSSKILNIYYDSSYKIRPPDQRCKGRAY